VHPTPTSPPYRQPLPGQPPPGQPYRPPRRKSRTGLVVGLVITGVLVLICGAPTAFFAIRYAGFETGPHSTLPNVCTVLDGPTISALVGDAPSERHKAEAADAGYPVEGCIWRPDDTPTGVQVNVRSVLYTRSFWSGSTDKARERMADDQRSKQEFVADRAASSSPAALANLPGAGHEGFCYATAGNKSIYVYECQARDGNVVISITVHPPPAGGGNADLTESDVHGAAVEFTDTARDLANDLIEDLR
jgi:hypothetical protein